jgi:hypothetical protein
MSRSMRKPQWYCLVTCCWISAVVSSYCQSSTNGSPGSVTPTAEVYITLSPQRCNVGTSITVRFEIRNTGSVPFYIPQVVEDIGSLGGFYAQVTSSPGARASRSVIAGDPVPGWHRDILTEVKERWILLRPGDFYGATRPLNTFVPLSPGKFKIVARHSAPRLSTEEKDRLRAALEFPVLLETVESQPAYWKS